jgi:hypothetical protein
MEYTSEQLLLEEYRKHPKFLRRTAWGDFIARWPWEWFATFTFTDDTHPERATKLYRVWVNRLNKSLFGPRWHKRKPYGVYWILAIEYQKSGRIHLHALITGVRETRRFDWMDDWFDLDKLAGYPRIFPVENQIGVSKYVTKYVSKDGDIYFSNNLKDISGDLVAIAADPDMGQTSERIAPGVQSSERR